MEKQKIPWASIAIVIVSALMMTFALRAPQLLSHAAEDQSTPVTQKLGSHTYALPRELIEMIYKPDYSGAPNPNPNWPHDPVVVL
jgi:hypothetical protein